MNICCVKPLVEQSQQSQATPEELEVQADVNTCVDTYVCCNVLERKWVM